MSVEYEDRLQALAGNAAQQLGMDWEKMPWDVDQRHACLREGYDWNAPTRDQMMVAVRTILREAPNHMAKLVPREPTEKMIQQGLVYLAGVDRDALIAAWRVMYDTAPCDSSETGA